MLEGHGLATVCLAQVRGQIERIRPPRALYAEFPLGRPLGRPLDRAFQHRVLAAAFALLGRPSGPVLETFPETIDDEADEPVVCPLPPRFDPNLPAAVDEAVGLRAAYERARRASKGRTLVGNAVDAETIPDAVAAFARVADGTDWDNAGIPGPPRLVAMDIRAYYEEAALALLEHVPAARSTESWFYTVTETGRMLIAARDRIRDAGGPWFGITPMTR